MGVVKQTYSVDLSGFNHDNHVSWCLSTLRQKKSGNQMWLAGLPQPMMFDEFSIETPYVLWILDDHPQWDPHFLPAPPRFGTYVRWWPTTRWGVACWGAGLAGLVGWLGGTWGEHEGTGIFGAMVDAKFWQLVLIVWLSIDRIMFSVVLLCVLILYSMFPSILA